MGCKKEGPKKQAPTVITGGQVTEIGSESARIGGEISSDGGDSVRERGICWSSNNQMPDLREGKTSEGKGLGSFVCTVTGLRSNTGYYARAYATNSMGTGYGKTISFTTLEILSDFLPLNPGARYRYDYLQTYQDIYVSYTIKGISTWTYLPQSPDAPQFYPVQKSFTGDSIYILDFGYGPVVKDSVHLENKISTFRLEVKNNGQVAWNEMEINRFLRTDKTDTCYYWSFHNGFCLRKNVGFTSLSSFACGNHCYTSKYTLIQGPY
jgi:hypothetical protein